MWQNSEPIWMYFRIHVVLKLLGARLWRWLGDRMDRNQVSLMNIYFLEYNVYTDCDAALKHFE